MPLFDDVDLQSLLNAPEWTEAHNCFPDIASKKKRPYEELHELTPLWLYARICLEDEEYRLDDGIHQDQREVVSYTDADTGPSTQPLVDRLPRSVLARIFEHLRDRLCLSSVSASDTKSPSTSAPSLMFSKSACDGRHRRASLYAWLNTVTLTCRRWRNAAFSHPPLWAYIDLSYEREVVRSLLILSVDQSLHVYADTSFLSLPLSLSSSSLDHRTEARTAVKTARLSKTGKTGVREIGEFEIKLDLILDERGRIAELEMNLTEGKFLKLVPWRGFACPLFPWIRLRTLVLRGPPPLPPAENTTRSGSSEEGKRASMIPLTLSAKNFPRLRELILDGLYPDWKKTRLSELTRLEVKNVPKSELLDFN